MAYTATNSEKVLKTARAAFFTDFEAIGTKFNMARWVTVMDTEDPNIDAAWLGAVPSPEKWVSEPVEKAMKTYEHRIAVDRWHHDVGFDQLLAEDDKTGQVAARASQMGAAARRHVDKFATQVLEAGTGTTLGIAYDGAPFHDATGHTESGTAQSNDFTSDIATPASPTAAELEPAIDNMIATMSAYTDDQGNPFAIELYDSLTFMIPPNFRSIFSQVLGEAGSLGGKIGAHAADTTGIDGRLRGWNFVVNPYMTNDDRFFAMIDGLPGTVAPLILVNRRGWTFQVFDRFNSVQHAKQSRIEYFGDARYGMGFGAWQASSVHIFT